MHNCHFFFVGNFFCVSHLLDLGFVVCFTFFYCLLCCRGCIFSNKIVDKPIPNKLFDGCYGGNVSPILASS